MSTLLVGVSRHDYLPFLGEVPANFRTGIPGCAIGDGTRQKFTGYEADAETGLNFAQARYQSPVQGRFTSVDPLGASANIGNPQSLNRYSYVENDPLDAIDPTGMMLSDIGIVQTQDEQFARTLQGASDANFQMTINSQYAVTHGFSINGINNGLTTQFSPAVAASQSPTQSPSSPGSTGDDDVIRTTVRASGSEDPQTFWQRRYANQLQSDIVGTTVVWNRQNSAILWIGFPQDFEHTVSALSSHGYLTGPANFAYNPYHHSGGQEFRDPDSRWGHISFHFMVQYPSVQIQWMPPTMGPPIIFEDHSPARGIHVHVDFHNPNTELIPHAIDVMRDVWRDIQRRFGPR